MDKNTIVIKTPVGKGYPIYIREGAFAEFIADIFAHHGRGKICFIFDSNISEYYLKKLQETIRTVNSVSGDAVGFYEFMAGEASKNRDTKRDIEDFLLNRKYDRETTLIAFGGGVVGDLTGFTASTYLRGVKYVQIPTTVVSMIDSSIGGKTGVDTGYGKNLLGTFYQPAAVYIDPDMLATLPDSEYFDGFAEIIKAAVIGDKFLFSYLNRFAEELKQRSPAPLLEAIRRSIAVKKKAVEKDPFERLGVRRILNFGHTVAHAVEHNSNYKYSHGVCVAIGMAAEAKIGERLGVSSAGLYESVCDLVQKFNLPIEIPAEMKNREAGEKLIQSMLSDKKSSSGSIFMALPCSVGRMAKGQRSGLFGGSYRIEVPNRLLQEMLCEE